MIAILDYGVGNLGSILNMIKKAGTKAVISSDEKLISQADKLILPGVGAFDNGMQHLIDSELIPILNKKVLEDKVPLLGICLGMQLMTNGSEEGNLKGLGWIDAEVIKFRFESGSKLKVPHMGWNLISNKKDSYLFDGMYKDPRFYFVHSYYVKNNNEENILAETHFGNDFTSAVINDNIIGTQFHPEKSHKFGLKLMQNFINN
ncbi:imidazole glycerol phosphate synthase subunit HisH [soil metagenome]